MRASVLVIALGSAVVCSTSTVAHADSAVDVAAPAFPARHFTLTVSGGISRGSYEAGLNWAIVTALRGTRVKPEVAGFSADLDVITGASAGTINTFLSALTWCRPLADDPHHEPELPKTSLFWAAWIPVSYGALFDPSREPSYGDALFSRAAFHDAISTVAKQITGTDYRPCHVLLGTTLTPAHAEKLPFRNKNVKVPDMRFVVPLALDVDDDQTAPRFSNFGDDVARDELTTRAALEALAQQGPTWALPTSAAASATSATSNTPMKPGAIGIDDVLRLSFAASAFPAAFGHVCVAGELRDVHGARIGAVSKCPAPASTCALDDFDCRFLDAKCDELGGPACRFFLDGGVFDNIPLALASALANAGPTHGLHDAKLIYIDPDVRRCAPSDERKECDVDDATGKRPPYRARGVGAVTDMLSEAVPAARAYELQLYLRTQENPPSSSTTQQQVASAELVSRRFPSIVGETMLSFGAFFLEEFRAYDFYAGVYDGVVGMAEVVACPNDTECSYDKLAPAIALIMPALNLDKDPDAQYVVARLAALEHPALPQPPAGQRKVNPLIEAVADANAVILAQDIRGDDSDNKSCRGVERALDDSCRLARIARLVAHHPRVEEAKAMLRDEQAKLAATCATSPTALRCNWRPREINEALDFLDEDKWDHWFSGQVFQWLHRARDIEKRDAATAALHGEPHPLAQASSVGVVVTETVLRSAATFEETGWWTPSTSLPNPAADALFPYRLNLDIARGTVGVGFRPVVAKPCRWFGVGLELTSPVLDVVHFRPKTELTSAADVVTRVFVSSDAGVVIEPHAGVGVAWLDASGPARAWSLHAGVDLVLVYKLRFGFAWAVGPGVIGTPWSVVVGVDDLSGIAWNVARAL